MKQGITVGPDPVLRPLKGTDVHIDVGATSHVGRVRAVNEDSYVATGQLQVVADGMGGHACGDVASSLAAESFRELAAQGDLTQESVKRAISQSNSTILAEGAAHPEKAGMGTTIAGLALISWGGSSHWMAFNVGDSRIYLVTGEGITRVSVDHSEVSELVAAGRITEQEARTHPLRNVVTRSLGTDPEPSVDAWLFPPESGERFVVCSDGLSNELLDVEIARITRDASSAQAAADALVQAAVDAGGNDNVTAVVVVVGAGAGEDEDEETSTLPRGSLEADLG